MQPSRHYERCTALWARHGAALYSAPKLTRSTALNALRNMVYAAAFRCVSHMHFKACSCATGFVPLSTNLRDKPDDTP